MTDHYHNLRLLNKGIDNSELWICVKDNCTYQRYKPGITKVLDTRKIIIECLEAGACSWEEITTYLRIKGIENPNSISFHLRNLIEEKKVMASLEKFSLIEGKKAQ